MSVHSGRLSTARRLRAVVLCSSMVGLVALSARPVLGGPDIALGPFRPTAESLKQYSYPYLFRDAKLGIWAHWGPQSVPMFGDWYYNRNWKYLGADWVIPILVDIVSK